MNRPSDANDLFSPSETDPSVHPASAGADSALPGSDSTMTTPDFDPTQETLRDDLAEVELTPAEWAECEAALRSVGIDPEHGGRLDLEGDARSAADAPHDAFLSRVLAVDQRRARVIRRNSHRRRFELRETLAAAGYRVDLGSRWSRGLRLAFAYGRLRLRESRALRIAGVLLFMHALAVPVMAWVSYKRIEPEYQYHGVSTSWTLPAPTFLEQDVVQELVVEEPIEPIDREDPR